MSSVEEKDLHLCENSGGDNFANVENVFMNGNVTKWGSDFFDENVTDNEFDGENWANQTCKQFYD